MKSVNRINIDSENPLYLIFNNVDGYIEESKSCTIYIIFLVIFFIISISIYFQWYSIKIRLKQ